jgi:hypothetical protein
MSRGFGREAHVMTNVLWPKPQHIEADADHEQAKQGQQLGAAELLAEACAKECARHARGGEDKRTRPFHRTEPSMRGKARGRVQRHGDGGGANSDMRGACCQAPSRG